MSLSDKPLIGVHLDLKGMQFKASYDAELLTDLAAQGINTVLVEYEDMFPFTQNDIALDRKRVWSRARLKAFLDMAAQLGIEVIPLQQCLGHLEYLFRWDHYVSLAEDKKYPSTLSLRSKQGRAFVKDLLRQVLDAHPGSRYIHLGMDEASGLLLAAKRSGRPVLELFTEWLDELLAVVEPYGKTPIIWSDMLEDHFTPDLLKEYRDRVILGPWDYCTEDAEWSVRGRMHGWRCHQAWKASPENPQAPALGEGSRFFEDLPKPVQKLINPHCKGDRIRSFFQVDMFTKLGFRILGACALRVSVDGACVPDYTAHAGNIRGYADAICRNGQVGLIGTSWARGTSFCPPNFPTELQWPLVKVLVEAMGGKGVSFFKGVPEKKLWKTLRTISRNRKDWRLDKTVCEDLERMGIARKSHAFEWQGLELMAAYHALQRQVEFAILEVDFFAGNIHPVVAEWQRRIVDQARVSKEVRDLRKRITRHFGTRYHGMYFTEWLDTLFVAWEEALVRIGHTSRAKMALARARYAGGKAGVSLAAAKNTAKKVSRKKSVVRKKKV